MLAEFSAALTVRASDRILRRHLHTSAGSRAYPSPSPSSLWAHCRSKPCRRSESSNRNREPQHLTVRPQNDEAI